MGRPLAYLRSIVKARDIEQTVSDAILKIATTEQKVRCADAWYSMHITPYRTADHVIRGALIEFSKVLVGEKEEPTELQAAQRAILASLPEGLALLDEKLRITWGNTAFLECLQVDADVFGRAFEDLWGNKGEQPEVWQLLENVGADGRAFARVSTRLPFGPSQSQSVWFSARRLPTPDDRPVLTLIMIEDRVERGAS